MRMRLLDNVKLAFALRQVFKVRSTHPLPLLLPQPPIDWGLPYAILAEECTLEKNIEKAFDEISSLYSRIIRTGSS